MEFNLGKKKGIIRFNKGFKPKSLSNFIKTYDKVVDEETLTDIFHKLNGSNRQSYKQPRETKRKQSNKDVVSGGGRGKRGNSKKE